MSAPAERWDAYHAAVESIIRPDLRELAKLAAALGHRRHWCVWKAEPVLDEDGAPKLKPSGRVKVSKAPRKPDGGWNASTTDPGTWAHFDQCAAALSDPALELAGLGIVLAEDDPFAGLDLDDCRDAAGTLTPEARELVRRLDGWAEVSPSGRGVRVLVRGGRWTRKSDAVEIYHRDRFLTLTACRLEESRADVPPRQSVLDALGAERGWSDATLPPVVVPADAAGDLTDADREWIAIVCDVDLVVARLYAGRWQELPPWITTKWRDTSPSSADASLAARLLKYGAEPARVVRLMRASGLARSKYEERRPGGDYVTFTVGRLAARVAADSAGVAA